MAEKQQNQEVLQDDRWMENGKLKAKKVIKKPVKSRKGRNIGESISTTEVTYTKPQIFKQQVQEDLENMRQELKQLREMVQDKKTKMTDELKEFQRKQNELKEVNRMQEVETRLQNVEEGYNETEEELKKIKKTLKNGTDSQH